MSTHPTAGAPAANQYGVFKVHYATPAQVGFVASLLAGRDLTGDLTADERSTIESAQDGVATGKLNKKHASAAIDLLLALPELPAPKVDPGHIPFAMRASDKQVALVKKLLDEKDVTGTLYNAPAWVDGVTGPDGIVRHPADHMTKREASDIIDALFKCPRKNAPVKVGSGPVEGMHFIDGVVIKVQRAVHGSGNLYAKQLVVLTEAELAADGTVLVPATAKFEYAPGVVNKTSVETLMTKEDGAKFGRLYGMCIKCAATLTDEESIERGMGPICAGKGWA
jgi:hypothetical protein